LEINERKGKRKKVKKQDWKKAGLEKGKEGQA